MAGAVLFALALLGVPAIRPVPAHSNDVAQLQPFFLAGAGWCLVWAVVNIPVRRRKLATRLDAWLGAGARTRWFLIGMIVGCSVAYAGASWLRHALFNSTGFDLGIQDQVIWNTARGHLYESSVETRYYLGDHLQPLLAVLALPYKLYPSVAWLFGAQSLCLAVAAIPLANLARRRLASPLAAIVFVLVYCLYPILGYVNRFDFHAEVIAVPLLLAAWDALDQDQTGWASMWLVMALLAKEDVGLTIAGMGLVLILTRRNPRFGLVWLAIGLGYSLFAMYVVIPTFRHGASDTLGRYGWLGANPRDMLATLATRPRFVIEEAGRLGWKVLLLYLFAPVALLPFLSPITLLAVLPNLSYNLLSGYAAQHTPYFHYTVPAIAGIMAASVYGAATLLRWFDRRRQRRRSGWEVADFRLALLSLLLVFGLTAFWLENPLSDGAQNAELRAQVANVGAVRHALAATPQNGHLFTTNHYAPHLSQRLGLTIYMESDEFASAIRQADILFVNSWDSRDTSPDQYARMLAMARAQGFRVTFAEDGVLVMKRPELHLPAAHHVFLPSIVAANPPTQEPPWELLLRRLSAEPAFRQQ